jgi:hypothetical protein
MIRAARYIYLGLAVAFVIGLVVQVFYAGMGVFGASDFEVHVGLGWMLHLVPVLILVAAAVGRAGRRRILWAAALAATIFVVPILALMRADAPALAALHPVGAVISFWLAIVVARDATTLQRAGVETAPEPV